MRSMRPFLTQYILFTACKALQLHTSQLSRLYPTVPHTRFSIRNPCLCLSESASPIEQKISMEILKLSTSRSRSPQIPTKFAVVGDPQKIPEKEYSIDTILKELAEIQRQGPKNYCILGTRHCTFLHQQIIELLAYALVLGGNHVFTSGAGGTNAATIRGALRAERPDLLTVVLPQSLSKQSAESQELLQQVKNVLSTPKNDHLRLDVASRLCNSDLLSRVDQLICFAFHDSFTIIETAREARALDMIVTELYLDRGVSTDESNAEKGESIGSFE